jgi:hypothetical protein
MSMTQSLLDFILNLLRDNDAKAAFMADPDRALADAGLSDVCSEDVSDAMSYVAEYHPVALVGPREYNLGNTAVVQHAENDRPEYHDEWHDHGYRPGPDDGVVQQLQYITNNYAYTDSHDTLIDKSVNQSIWNTGTLSQRFDDNSVTATDHSVAAGRDVHDAATGNYDVVGRGNDVGNTTFTDDHSVKGSFNGNNVADHGGVAGDNADGNVTEPHNSEVATTGGRVSDSHDDIHTTVKDSNNSYDYDHSGNTTIKDSGNSYEHSDNSYDNVGNTDHHEHVAENSFNTVESHNEDSAISSNHQEGLVNLGVSPAVNVPIHDNDTDILNHIHL